MPIVADLSGNSGQSGPQDKPFATYNRTSAAAPDGVLTPQFSGEIVLDTTNAVLWKAMGTANNTWVALTAR